MKQYSVSSQLMLVGKAWEIRHQLRLLARQGPVRKAEKNCARTLGEYLEHRRPVSR
ncbi:Z-ring formation inhibitor MciZ [Paenibacillus sp. sptzw28]|uniref:Z-ring formation inhibitor MciZ n=1 Tax=Paenibacillus sp. sptzw28 TaxID=715179 RepID=UPI001C6E4243|nr:Z-ring formation inhibitor MciZ [Paenibacillus sp. sptzw28]QYR19979.1 Z-ring formation inhibitor MciZ [Paenibacillus sp. sptzw28]